MRERDTVCLRWPRAMLLTSKLQNSRVVRETGREGLRPRLCLFCLSSCPPPSSLCLLSFTAYPSIASDPVLFFSFIFFLCLSLTCSQFFPILCQLSLSPPFELSLIMLLQSERATNITLFILFLSVCKHSPPLPHTLL